MKKPYAITADDTIYKSFVVCVYDKVHGNLSSDVLNNINRANNSNHRLKAFKSD